MRQRIRDISLSWRLTALYVAILAAVLTSLGVVLYAQVQDFLIKDTASRLQASAKPPGGPMPRRGNDGGGYEPLRLAELAKNISSRDTTVQIIGPDGTILATAVPYNGRPTAPPADPNNVRLVLAGQSVPPANLTDNDEHRLVILQPFQINETTAGVLQLTTSLAAADDLLARLRLVLIIGVLGAVALGALLGVPVTRAALKPLARMTTTSEEIAAGDLSQRTNLLSGRDEIGRLATAFDSMVDQLEGTLRAQRQFVADASHELRTPLTALGGLIEMLLLGVDRGDTKTTQRALRSAHREIERLSRLVGDLLTLSRLDAHPTLNQRPLDLNAVVSEVGEQTRYLAGERTVRWRTDGPLPIEGDADKLKQVFLNLTGNAVAFTTTSGTIELHASRRGNAAQIEVTDDGAGIAPEDLPRLFERFYRGDKSRARRADGGGNGLGLAIARAIIEAHSGTISARSTVGKGTTFIVTLPLAPTPPTTPEASSPGVVAAERSAAHEGRAGVALKEPPSLR
ncbi:MAG TPA: ATP-binding protein [Thermomicrobiales bacterium]|jgi:two-component system OmpR family sensor kinase